ncbi:hypothetical protein COO60DRAFT_1636809 [Scenedesmus sp. NREL 46B-D3]|nr:hypothetical protein COO60DRAFT_1636809 [Scenedesmus sp. NREL 46B-D3]
MVKRYRATKKKFRSVIGAFVTPLRAAQEWWKDYAAYAKLLARNDPLLRVAVKKLDKAFAGMPVAEAALQELWDLSLATEKCMRTSQAQVVHCLQDITGLPQQVLMLLGGEGREDLRLVFRKLNQFPPLKRAVLPQLRNLKALQEIAPHLYLQRAKTMVADVMPAVQTEQQQQDMAKALQEIAPHLYLQRAKTMVEVRRNLLQRL